MKCQLGCYNRPWKEFSLDDAFKGIKDAGFDYVSFMKHRFGPDTVGHIITEDQNNDFIDEVISKAKSYGVTPLMQHGKLSRRMIDKVKYAGLKYITTSGGYFDELPDIAEYARQQGITIAIKPHGGPCPTGRHCLEVVKKVNNPVFRIFYDASNTMRAGGADPADEIDEVAPYVTALAVKDAKDGSPLVTPGDGIVDFEIVFKALAKVDFSGPVMVETMAEGDLDQVNRDAKRVYKFLTDIINSV